MYTYQLSVIRGGSISLTRFGEHSTKMGQTIHAARGSEAGRALAGIWRLSHSGTVLTFDTAAWVLADLVWRHAQFD